MPSYLYYVQTAEGREVVSAHVDVQKVSDVTAHWDTDTDEVFLNVDDLVVEQGMYHGEGPLTLYRVPSEDKLATPVAHPVQ